MSRFDHTDWDGEGPPPELWQQAVRNAARGRRGQAALRELLAALQALPRPQLISGAVVQDGEVCALGALAAHRLAQGQPIAWGGEAVATLAHLEAVAGGDLHDEWGTTELGEAMGLRRALAWAIAYENDEGVWGEETPAQRWTRMVAWVEGYLDNAVDTVGAERLQ